MGVSVGSGVSMGDGRKVRSNMWSQFTDRYYRHYVPYTLHLRTSIDDMNDFAAGPEFH